MRIHRLQVEGFGPFLERQTVDFDAFAADGLFLISGRTGAGKSSILDAICYALYGTAPRYEEGDKRVRSDHAAPGDPTIVALEFSAAGRLWRIERSPEFARPKKHGDGMTTQPASASLSEYVDGVWIGVAARLVDVGTKLDEVVGLSAKQFQQVILLAQNKFSRFLLAKNDERQALLRTLFDSQRFDDYEKRLDARRKEIETEASGKTQVLESLLTAAESAVATEASADAEADDAPGDVDRPEVGLEAPARGAATLGERLAALDDAVLRARYRAEVASNDEAARRGEHLRAEADHAEAVAVAEKQIRRSRSRAALLVLDEREDAIDELRGELREAQSAEGLRAPIDAVGRAFRARTAARDAESAAREEWSRLDGSSDNGAEALDTHADVLRQHVGTWQGTALIEAALPARERALTGTLARADEVAGLIELTRAGLDQSGERHATIAARVEPLSAEAAREHDARERQIELKRRIEAARTASSLRERAAKATQVAIDAGAAMQGASHHLDQLRERRLRGYAGELAEALVDGVACAVCGSAEHPAPAPRGDAPVTPADIELAEAAKEASVSAESEASAALRTAERALTDAEAAAGGQSIDELTLELEANARIVGTAVEARTALAAVTAELAELSAERSASEKMLGDLLSEQAALTERLSVEAPALDRDRRAVDEVRGEFEAVSARIAATETLIDAARRLSQSLRLVEQSELAWAEASDDLASRLSETGFDDAEAAGLALRSHAARESLDHQIRVYDAERSAERAALMQLELEMLPEEPVDVSVTASARSVAADAWSTAVAHKATASERAESLDRDVFTARVTFEGIAALSEEVMTIRKLAGTISGHEPNSKRMNLETFVLAAELEEIVDAANLRLDDMSSGRYALQHSDARASRGAASGLGLQVMDRHTGQARPAQSLSGGETFLASLALALGLAEVVTSRAGGITLDTLFIDEGFGSLDADTLDIAMRTLDELRQGGRTIGVISHVEAMKEQIPGQLGVRTRPDGTSKIEQAAQPESVGGSILR